MDRTGIDAKLGRASHLVADVDSEVSAFFQREPYALEERAASNGDLVYYVRIRENPPIHLSTLIGDALHNARSALDHLAYALVLEGGGTPDESTHFPIRDSQMGYGPRLNSGLRGATQASREAVKRLKPWQGGDDSLWKLHKLDNIDKHRLLLPVGSVNRGITFSGFGDRSINPPIEVFAEDQQYPLKDGAEVFRIMKQAIHGAASKDKFGITFSVAFGEGSVVNGEPVVPTVRGLVEHVRDTIHRVISEIGSA